MEPKLDCEIKIYDAGSGRTLKLEPLIRRLGIAAVAKRYDVSESTVRKWLRHIHRPSRRSVIQSVKKLL